ncbi:hypothetical protein ACFQI7_15280 [Paenibacillus allorhizosphaerae]|uniref:Uncharacterized protein n=1 Tax=Paenibacillus allorhizosphaerae TaxID=2849866 RepID=A0ABM8VDP4_9BACL|nr:hypothetical protein [Paenibacillus allorhizosphaerae]CAG7628245.1 hypothetical protein PAECIP111802_01437 [Paenibacillus allorhizosphaerae]
MPYVLRHTQTGEIAACVQRNNYNLDYFGVKQWDQEPVAEQEKHHFLEAIGEEDPGLWVPTHADENRVKVFNVKLKNDPSRRLLMDSEGNLSVQTRA